MNEKNLTGPEKVKGFFFLLVQRLWICFELFNRNGLVNHAAACAYNFLLSAAPALLFVAFVISRAMTVIPELTENLLDDFGLLVNVSGIGNLNIKGLIENFLGSAGSGLAAIISIVMIFWTARLCALSAKRGLGVIFPGSRSVIKDNAVTLALGFLTIMVIFIALIGLRLTLYLYKSPDFAFLKGPALAFLVKAFSMTGLALLVLAAYRFVPACPPGLKNIIQGVLMYMIFYIGFTTVFSLMVNPDRYNLLYGTLGRLFLFLVNVYFFFVFFFFGGQLIYVLEFSDTLLFARYRKIHSKLTVPLPILDKLLFASLPGPLEKYSKIYKKGDFVFAMHSHGQEVYYILSGLAGVYLDDECRNRIATIDEAHFFGEMASVASDSRTASVKAETDLSVLVLPPELFSSILKHDPDTDKSIIKALSERLMSVNQQIL